MLTARTTLTQFLIEERRRHPSASGELNAHVLDVAMACKAISRVVAHGTLRDALRDLPGDGAQEEPRKKGDVLANEMFLRSNEWGGHLAAMLSEAMELPYAIPSQYQKGGYLLLFDPLDGSPDIDVNMSAGSIFSILRASNPGVDAVAADFLQAGTSQVCAGYAIYGPSTMLVLTVGTGAHAFTLDPMLGEFILTHAALAIPGATTEFAINSSSSCFWEPAVKRYVDECLAGKTGPRGRDFTMRWIASLVAETHRILMRGGIFLCPRDARDPVQRGQLHLLYKANPIAFIVEQAGGHASNGRKRVLDIGPQELHQRVGFVFGSRDEVERVEEYHRNHNLREFEAPLFGMRGLFRAVG